MNVPERIRELRESRGISQEALAEILGVDRTTIVKYESGGSRPTRNLKKLADYFHVSTDYLLGNTDAKRAGLFQLNETNRVPVIGSVRCGPDGPAYEYIDEYIAIDDGYRPEEMRGFLATGDSMEGDEIHDGDVCLVHLQEEVPDGSIAVVVIDGEEGTMKHFHRDEDKGVIVLQSSNPAYPPRIFAGEDANSVRVIGRVVEVRHKK